MNLFHPPPNTFIPRQLSANWIQVGHTWLTCRDIRDGGYRVTFTGDKLLHGSYGGVNEIPVGVGNLLAYGFTKIDICDQSPVIIQLQSATPVRQEPVDGTVFMKFDL